MGHYSWMKKMAMATCAVCGGVGEDDGFAFRREGKEPGDGLTCKMNSKDGSGEVEFLLASSDKSACIACLFDVAASMAARRDMRVRLVLREKEPSK